MLDALAARFGRGQSPGDFIETAWWTEPWTRGGSKAHFPPGLLTRYGPLLRGALRTGALGRHRDLDPLARRHRRGGPVGSASRGGGPGPKRPGEAPCLAWVRTRWQASLSARHDRVTIRWSSGVQARSTGPAPRGARDSSATGCGDRPPRSPRPGRASCWACATRPGLRRGHHDADARRPVREPPGLVTLGGRAWRFPRRTAQPKVEGRTGFLTGKSWPAIALGRILNNDEHDGLSMRHGPLTRCRSRRRGRPRAQAPTRCPSMGLFAWRRTTGESMLRAGACG